MANKFQEKKIMVEVLDELYSTLEAKVKSVHYEYKIVGKKDTQSRHWNTGELLWEDEEKTIPRMDDDWREVEKEELTEEDELRLKVYKYLMVQLEKML